MDIDSREAFSGCFFLPQLKREQKDASKHPLDKSWTHLYLNTDLL
jgi:hypothetical protein